ncbi:hypothetical protein NC652_017293 [Populus alba x Populus x berolinensis]|uniref:Uncharacterized protein n=1 Tax=Populus alba x Populus x berolinensis TaxID=444605 RepID=A0AAD6QPR9_9ROSI|nr:hypothetical protein NC652_017293 [Populus alba x Populus x berolinensis]KAJ6994301.1 hypothetical protein NC653_017203 [Populus alba x Populus x berolinensis]
MAKVAAPGGLLGCVTVQIGGGGAASLTDGPMVRRKTPSELRGEQLKRTKVLEIVDESPMGSKNNSCAVDNGPRKPDASRTPRYIDTRMDEVYPAKKSRLRMLSVKDSAKEITSTEQPISLKNITMLSTLAAKRRQLSCPENSVASDEVSKDGVVQPRQTIENCSQSIFRSVAQLSSSGEKSSGLAFVDMDKALKGLVAHETPYTSGLNAASEKAGNHSGNFCSECNIAGLKAPLDFTLKTRMRVASSCSVNRIHRSIMSSTYNGMPQLAFQFGDSQDNRSSGQALASQILSSKALHSWVYPQSTLPAAVISVLTSSATEGGCQIKTIILINCFLLPSSFLFLTFLLFICGHRFYKKTATGVGGFFSESLLHASKEHLQYFLCVHFTICGDVH